MSTQAKLYSLTIVLLLGTITLFSLAKHDVVNTVSMLPAESETPASGICADVPRISRAVLILHTDSPSPRCQKVTSDQTIVVSNDTPADLRMSFGSNAAFTATIPAHGSYQFPGNVGKLFAQGVHTMSLDGAPYAGTEIWVVAP
jgi:hypothetical protein